MLLGFCHSILIFLVKGFLICTYGMATVWGGFHLNALWDATAGCSFRQNRIRVFMSNIRIHRRHLFVVGLQPIRTEGRQPKIRDTCITIFVRNNIHQYCVVYWVPILQYRSTCKVFAFCHYIPVVRIRRTNCCSTYIIATPPVNFYSFDMT